MKRKNTDVAYDSYFAGATSCAFGFPRQPPAIADKSKWLRGYDEYPDRLAEAQRRQMQRTINRIEFEYFGDSDGNIRRYG